MPEQLVFDWPRDEALRPEDFFVSDANRVAADLIQTPDAWPAGKLVLTGPEGCGKSHLARVFQVNTDAMIMTAADLSEGLRPNGALVIEDMSALPAQREEAMFHLHNHMASAALPLLMTDRSPPARWNIALPDLASRMQATTPVAIEDPDDMLLQVLIMKLFADRQVIPPASVVQFLSTRIERSYVAVQDIVARLDHAAFVDKKPASVKMATALLDKTGDQGA
jgi:chromosomal replication initiation ATPase DnaA